MGAGGGGGRGAMLFVGILASVKHYDSTTCRSYLSSFFPEIPSLVVLECQSYSQFHRCSCLLQI